MITREIINKNIKFRDVHRPSVDKSQGNSKLEYITHEYSYDELSKSIDICKNILEHKYKAQARKTALIAANPSKMQIALIFACAELGITVIVVDYDRADKWAGEDYIDPKTKSLLPINYFLYDRINNSNGKYQLFNKICDKVIVISEEKDIDTTPNLTINATPETIFIKCTSSGTTGTPKIIEHTHDFIYEVSNRNKIFFDNSVGLLFNLNHGSSVATYFLPSLMSDKVKECHSILWTHTNLTVDKKLDHLMIPYPHYIDMFLKNNINNTENMIIYTLSTIRKEWLSYIKQNKIKDIVSIFGSNETSGPVLINMGSDPQFYESKYKSIDDFYNISISDDGDFLVTLPVYNKTINTNDKFKFTNNSFYHLGRNDLIRVNGEHINVTKYQETAKQFLDCDLIFDSVRNNIFLAIWKESEDMNNKIKLIDKNLRNFSQGAHYIQNYEILNFDDFVSGVKIDQELLRDYFRNYTTKKY